MCFFPDDMIVDMETVALFSKGNNKAKKFMGLIANLLVAEPIENLAFMDLRMCPYVKNNKCKITGVGCEGMPGDVRMFLEDCDTYNKRIKENK